MARRQQGLHSATRSEVEGPLDRAPNRERGERSRGGAEQHLPPCGGGRRVRAIVSKEEPVVLAELDPAQELVSGELEEAGLDERLRIGGGERPCGLRGADRLPKPPEPCEDAEIASFGEPPEVHVAPVQGERRAAPERGGDLCLRVPGSPERRAKAGQNLSVGLREVRRLCRAHARRE